MTKVLFPIPGLLCDAPVWQEQIKALAGRYDVCVPDLRGHSSPVDMARSVLAAAPESFSVAGHSMGQVWRSKCSGSPRSGCVASRYWTPGFIR